jgi:hypothetical protein
MNKVRERWLRRLMSNMPPEENILARNQEITARYAGWYLSHPMLYKWSGMAVFASAQVGEFLSMAHGENRIRRRIASRLFGESFDLVRETNNEVFSDIGWALLAFASEGGLQEVEEGLSDLTGTHSLLLRAFQRLDEAKKSGDQSLVWEAARDMLQHEQRYSVQPRFARFPGVFRGWLSLSASGGFPVPGVQKTTRRYFLPFMLRRGILLPDLTVFEQRWSWINAEVLDLWRQLDEQTPPQLASLMERQRGLQ